MSDFNVQLSNIKRQLKFKPVFILHYSMKTSSAVKCPYGFLVFWKTGHNNFQQRDGLDDEPDFHPFCTSQKHRRQHMITLQDLLIKKWLSTRIFGTNNVTWTAGVLFLLWREKKRKEKSVNEISWKQKNPFLSLFSFPSTNECRILRNRKSIFERFQFSTFKYKTKKIKVLSRLSVTSPPSFSRLVNSLDTIHFFGFV